ncbi:MAG TPA: VOC family protein [Conexibacter sp.]|nr:VOC family protein [Conexibacter sp.]
MTQTRPPLAIAHIGITVPDLDAAVAWYGELFGFRLIAPPGEVHPDQGGHVGMLVSEILGPRCKHMRQAHLATANGAAVELFQFVDPPYEAPEDNFTWWRGGIFHFCVIDPDVAGLARRIADSGGRQRSPVRRIFEEQPYEVSYCEDPWGTIVEIYSHSHEQIYANHAALASED